MKISNSKKELARIISENGGWRERGKFATQDKGDFKIGFWNCKERPVRERDTWKGDGWLGTINAIPCHELLPNWHKTILSREEYFNLYPAPDAKTEFCESVTRSIPEHESKPTIEQLAADYRNSKDYADRKQAEADAAKADEEAKLAELVAAGKALNLVISVSEKEPELVITDWRDLQVGDEIEYIDGTSPHWVGREGVVELIDEDGEYHILFRRGDKGDSDDPTNWMSTRWCSEFLFIRRP